MKDTAVTAPSTEQRSEPTYPRTPVDCLISELREIMLWDELLLRRFDERVQLFKDEVAA